MTKEQQDNAKESTDRCMHFYVDWMSGICNGCGRLIPLVVDRRKNQSKTSRIQEWKEKYEEGNRGEE